MLSYLILAAAFAAASVTDIKRREIPVWLFPAACVLCRIAAGGISILDIIAAACVGFPLLFLCYTGRLGGGDLLMFVCTAIALGAEDMLLYVLALAAAATCFFFFIREKQQELPIAPVAGISYIIFLIIKIFI